MLNLPHTALSNAISARGIRLDVLAERTRIAQQRIARAVREDSGFEEDEITELANALAVPVRALFARQVLPYFPPVDFRTSDPGVGEFELGTLKAINFVEQLSSAISASGIETPLDDALVPVETDYTEAHAIELASSWRERWGLSIDEQLEIQDANQVYLSLRSFIEAQGVFVLHQSFGNTEAAGVYLEVADGPHTIIINSTRSSKARKLFTLAHEFCHVLIRAEGASNPSIIKNRIEKFCNKFAAYLLAPPALIRLGLERFRYEVRPDARFIRLFAARLGISQEALYIRLVEEGLLERQDYVAWKSSFSDGVPLGDTTDGSGGGGGDPLKTKRTLYGSALLSALARARARGQLDEIEIYRISGLKPFYQDQLFEAA